MQSNHRQEQYKDQTYKIILVGDSVVGKSSIVQSFVIKHFEVNTVPTLGVDIQFRDILVNNRNIKLQLWDTAGQDRYKSITRAYYKGADAVLVVYDTTDLNSFKSATDYWYNEMHQFIDEKTVKMLVGNKIDRPERQVSTIMGKQFSDEHQILFNEITASDPQMIEQMFIEFMEKVVQRNEIQDLQIQSNSKLSSQKKQLSCWNKMMNLFKFR